MPTLMDFQKRKNVKNPFNEVPRCYKSLLDGENDFLVLEDLSPEGYQMFSRTKGLDFPHCAKVFHMLGRFNALSYALKDQEPDLYQELVKNSVKETYYLASNKAWYSNSLHLFCLIAMDAISKEYPNTIYEEKFKKFAEDNLYDHLVDIVQRSKEPFGAIGHGDAWACNFLYKYHEESGDGSPKPEKTKMIDFQLARFGSPALDLSFFIYACTDQELREAHYEELIKIYHDSLSNFLHEMGLSSEKLFPFKAFKEELAKYSIHGLGLALEAVPLSLLESNEAPNIELMEGEEELTAASDVGVEIIGYYELPALVAWLVR
uniref:CHK kinase-like domain-containing protein n=1 Tax=Timema bartmani TaxID=61472 RepID=A0A7R9ET49_9NEOP|nr:unnamed protein product [Timema bartmani]